jgi:hypothetical protein
MEAEPVKPTRISRDDVGMLLRKAQQDGAPVDFTCTGPSEQALVLIGFLALQEDGAIVTVRAPKAVGAFFSLDDCQFEYSDPREAPAKHRSRAQDLLDFLRRFASGEWECLLRVWRRPGTPG